MPVKVAVEWDRRKILRTAAGLIAFWLVSAAVLFVPLAGWTSADVTTGRHPGYPDLQPHNYDMDPANTVRFAQAVIGRMRGWKVVRADASAGTLEATAPGFPAPSDVTLNVRTGGAYSLVVIRSRSRFGFADLGVNARHIRALQAAMDDKLPRVRWWNNTR
jgi:uncharacterized protein (DUF1499 family)